jgi:hypothetical protein
MLHGNSTIKVIGVLSEFFFLSNGFDSCKEENLYETATVVQYCCFSGLDPSFDILK